MRARIMEYQTLFFLNMCIDKSGSRDMSKGKSFTRVLVRLSAAKLLILALHWNNLRSENFMKKIIKKFKGEQ